ncbi:MAG: spore coat U domain-containing protein [Kofleriaceae bacterium]
MKSRTASIPIMIFTTAELAELASAGTATAHMGVTTTVVSQCTVDAGTMQFGNYNTTTGAQVDSEAALKVTCSKGTAASITLGGDRTMKSTDGHALGYKLYQDPQHAVPWGSTAATAAQYVAQSSAPAELKVYGQILANQDVPAGDYNDEVVATINF